MDGRGPLLFVRDDHRATLGAHEDLVLGHLEIEHREGVLVLAGGEKRRFVDEVFEVGAAHSGGAARDDVELDVGSERGLAGVDAEDGFAAADVGAVHGDAAVKTTRAQDGGIEHIRAVRGRDDDDAVVGLEPVHLDEELVQRLLALVVTAAHSRAAVTADGVDFVDEDDAGCMLLALLEEVANTACADAHEHLDEVGAGDAEEGHASFACDGAGEESLAGTWRADHEHALGDAPAEPLELLGILEEGDDLLDLVLGLVGAGDVREGDLVLGVGEHASLALAEAHRLATAGLELAHEDEEHEDDQHHRDEGDERARPEGRVVFLLEVDLRRRLLFRGGVGAKRGEQRFVREGARGRFLCGPRVTFRERVDVLAVLDVDVLHLAGVDLRHELAEGDGLLPLGVP